MLRLQDGFRFGEGRSLFNGQRITILIDLANWVLLVIPHLSLDISLVVVVEAPQIACLNRHRIIRI